LKNIFIQKGEHKMALNFVGKMNVPNYTALSTDVSTNKIAGASIIGAIVLLTDTGSWKVILSDLTLADYALPMSGTITTGGLTDTQLRATPVPVSQIRVVCSAGDVHAPAVNTAAIVTYTADATHKHVIAGVVWSYSGGTPVGGRLTITDAGTIVFDTDITDSGCGSFEFPRPKIQAAVNTALVVTLAAAGASVTGKLSVENHWIE
jgi:hypothetical protein